MNIKQVDQDRIETTIETTKSGEPHFVKKYYPITSKQGQELIKEHKLIIDPDMKEF